MPGRRFVILQRQQQSPVPSPPTAIRNTHTRAKWRQLQQLLHRRTVVIQQGRGFRAARFHNQIIAARTGVIFNLLSFGQRQRRGRRGQLQGEIIHSTQFRLAIPLPGGQNIGVGAVARTIDVPHALLRAVKGHPGGVAEKPAVLGGAPVGHIDFGSRRAEIVFRDGPFFQKPGGQGVTGVCVPTQSQHRQRHSIPPQKSSLIERLLQGGQIKSPARFPVVVGHVGTVQRPGQEHQILFSRDTIGGTKGGSRDALGQTVGPQPAHVGTGPLGNVSEGMGGGLGQGFILFSQKPHQHDGGFAAGHGPVQGVAFLGAAKQSEGMEELRLVLGVGVDFGIRTGPQVGYLIGGGADGQGQSGGQRQNDAASSHDNTSFPVDRLVVSINRIS